jgi:hypothetical protein
MNQMTIPIPQTEGQMQHWQTLPDAAEYSGAGSGRELHFRQSHGGEVYRVAASGAGLI